MNALEKLRIRIDRRIVNLKTRLREKESQFMIVEKETDELRTQIHEAELFLEMIDECERDST